MSQGLSAPGQTACSLTENQWALCAPRLTNQAGTQQAMTAGFWRSWPVCCLQGRLAGRIQQKAQQQRVDPFRVFHWIFMPHPREIFRRRNISFIFQAFNLIPELSVEQNITFPVLLDYKKPDKAHVEELLTVLSLQDRRGHLPGQLSGGQQQRVVIGRALVTRPMLILADEPTGNLDSKNSNEVISLLKTAAKRYSQTIIMITHSHSIASMADRVLQVSDGVLSDLGGYRE